MKWRNDGSVQSSNVPTLSNLFRKSDTALYRAIITEVIYTDDLKNTTRDSGSPRVLYNAVILGGFLSGTELRNCRMAPQIGGDFAFYERVLRPCSQPVSKTGLRDQDGDIVYIQFIQGHSSFPLIMGVDNGMYTSTYGLTGATRAQGRTLRSLFNQIYEGIDVTGNWEKIYGYDISGAGDHFLTESVNIEENRYLKLYNSGMAISEDVQNDTLYIKTGSNLSLELNGQENSVKITAPGTSIEIDGNTGKISLKGQYVDLGDAVADLVTKYVELAAAFATHMHMAPQAPTGTLPTTPPTAPLPISVGSQTVFVAD